MSLDMTMRSMIPMPVSIMGGKKNKGRSKGKSKSNKKSESDHSTTKKSNMTQAKLLDMKRRRFIHVALNHALQFTYSFYQQATVSSEKYLLLTYHFLLLLRIVHLYHELPSSSPIHHAFLNYIDDVLVLIKAYCSIIQVLYDGNHYHPSQKSDPWMIRIYELKQMVNSNGNDPTSWYSVANQLLHELACNRDTMVWRSSISTSTSGTIPIHHVVSQWSIYSILHYFKRLRVD